MRGKQASNTPIPWIRRVVERTSHVGVEPTTMIVRRWEERWGGRAVMSVCALSRTRLAKPCKPRCIHARTPKRWSPPTCSNGSHHIIGVHATGNQSVQEEARDDDGDGMREGHGNTAQGMGTDVRHVLRPAERRSPETSGGFRGDG
ncbi:MAG TPA: hypothetical protein VF043_08875 [Ktedonobacteraceae bacterium]